MQLPAFTHLATWHRSMEKQPEGQYIVAKQRAYADIEARYSCSHAEKELRQRTIADGRTTFVMQCIQCGNTSPPIARKKVALLAKGHAISPYRAQAEDEWRARKSAEYQQVFRDLAPALRTEYQRYLRSDAWLSRRKAVLERASYLCELCTQIVASEVHHLTYFRLGNELLSDLLAVCEDCHAFLHAAQSHPQNSPT